MRNHWNVLIVDNEPDILEVVSDMLELGGAKTFCVTSAEEALELLERFTPTFVLTDLSMPGMSGWELYMEMQRFPQTRHIPVIALTAHALLGDREKVLEFGFDGYIAKPFQMSHFMREIRKCLEQRAVA